MSSTKATGPVYSSGSPGNANATHERQANVSKSDRQLFGDYAPVVRQLGIAVDAAEQARTTLTESGIPAPECAPRVDEQDDTPTKALVELKDLEEHCRRVHQNIALRALQRARNCGSDQSPARGVVLTEPLTTERFGAEMRNFQKVYGARPTTLVVGHEVAIPHEVAYSLVDVAGGRVAQDLDLPPGSWLLSP